MRERIWVAKLIVVVVVIAATTTRCDARTCVQPSKHVFSNRRRSCGDTTLSHRPTAFVEADAAGINQQPERIIIIDVVVVVNACVGRTCKARCCWLGLDNGRLFRLPPRLGSIVGLSLARNGLA